MLNKSFEKILSTKEFNYYYSDALNSVAYEQITTDVNGNVITTDYAIFILMPPLIKLMDEYLRIVDMAQKEKKEVKQFLNDEKDTIYLRISDECRKFLEYLQEQGYPKNLNVFKPNQSLANNPIVNTFNTYTNTKLLFSVKHRETHLSYYSYQIDNDALYLYDIYGYKKSNTDAVEVNSIRLLPLFKQVCYKLIVRFNKKIDKKRNSKNPYEGLMN